MAIPSYVASGTEVSGVGDVAPGLPAGWTAGWIFLMSVEQSAVNVFPTTDIWPAGWDVVPDGQQKPGTGATDPAFTVLWKRAESTDGDPTVTDTINHTSAVIHGFSGCITTGEPWNVTSGGSSATSSTSAAITGDTTTVADCLIVIFAGSGTDITTDEFGNWANADLANVTERSDFMCADGNGGGVGMATGEKATAGAYGDTTVELVTASTKAFCTIALKPPVAGAVTAKTLAALGVG